MNLTFKLQGASEVTVALQLGWNFLVGPMGCHLWQCPNGSYAIRLTTGVYSANSGGVYLEYMHVSDVATITALLIPGMFRDTANTRLWLYPTGQHCIPPRSVRVWRLGLGPAWSSVGQLYDTPIIPGTDEFFGPVGIRLPNFRASWKTAYDGHADGMIAALQADTNYDPPLDPNMSFAPRIGVTRSIGFLDDPLPAGADGISFCRGWHRSSKFSLVKADLHMHRQRTDCVSAETGEPLDHALVDSSFYELTRGRDTGSGFNKVSELPQFCETIPGSPDPNARRFKYFNAGTCAYKVDIESVVPHAASHLTRTMTPQTEGWYQFGDPVCEFNLRMIAQDVAYKYNRQRIVAMVAGVPANVGGKIAGRREYGWAVDALAWAEHPNLTTVLRFARRHTMPNGLLVRNVSTDVNSFAPDPWAGGLNPNLAVYQFLEFCIANQGRIEGGNTFDTYRELNAAIRNVPWLQQQKWLVVGTTTAPSTSITQQWGIASATDGPESFYQWVAYGHALHLAPSSERQAFVSRMEGLHLPGTSTAVTGVQALIDALVANDNIAQTGTAIAYLETLVGEGC